MTGYAEVLGRGHWIASVVFGQQDVKVSRSRLGTITTTLGIFQPEFVVHRLAESLLAAEITFSGLHRCVSK
jgi:hypothetical protein